MKDGRYVVLGIYEVHMASAAIMADGEILAANHEERFTGLKNDVGFPVNAAKFCLEQAGISPEEIDAVAISNEFFNKNGAANILFKRPATYSIDEWIDENNKFWGPKLTEKASMDSYFELMGGWGRVGEHVYDTSKIDFNQNDDAFSDHFNQLRIDVVENELGISSDKVTYVPHYLCHHYHAYYSGSLRGDNTVIVHLEGDGGQYNSAVSIPTPEGLKFLYGSNSSDIGRLYQWVTLITGMKPYHHEYKLMGLAPYATPSEVEKTSKVLADIFKVTDENPIISYKQKPQDLYFSIRSMLEGHRFDGIAGALQKLVEDLLVEWVSKVTRSTGRSDVCYGGGVAMNVKANGELAASDVVSNLFVPLSPSDESNVFGACYYLTEQHFIAKGVSPESIPPLTNIYLGNSFSDTQVQEAVRKASTSVNFSVTESVDNDYVSDKLSDGAVIGRFVGRNEFGQRAMGNRSILASPQIESVERINKKIKYRDFWMPFCPSILDSYASSYLKEKSANNKYMTVGF